MEEKQSGHTELKEQTFEDYIRFIVDNSPPPPEHDYVAKYRTEKTSSFRTVGRIYETVTYSIAIYGGTDKKGKAVFGRRFSFRM